ncbi:uncharacterized protein METZ01_LOCUS92681 [marine metagenome]|uniref:Uncharacterized protein n=1 Tax=marine metagenome TaxID=408172 RepID=A0A381VJI9_9ZZZZ
MPIEVAALLLPRSLESVRLRSEFETMPIQACSEAAPNTH